MAIGRHPVQHATHRKALPVTMPSWKNPIYTSTRVALPDDSASSSDITTSTPSLLSRCSTLATSSYAGSHAGSIYDESYSRSGIDVVDELWCGFDACFRPMRMDSSLAKQVYL